jgi:hypothetical protein
MSLNLAVIVRDDLLSLKECFDALHASLTFADHAQIKEQIRITLFDDASSPKAADQFKQLIERERAVWPCSLQLMRSAVPFSFHKIAERILALEPKTDFVGFLSHTVRVRPDFFSQLHAGLLTRNPSTARLYGPRVRHQGRVFMGCRVDRLRLRRQPVPPHPDLQRVEMPFRECFFLPAFAVGEAKNVFSALPTVGFAEWDLQRRFEERRGGFSPLDFEVELVAFDSEPLNQSTLAARRRLLENPSLEFGPKAKAIAKLSLELESLKKKLGL